MGREVLLQYTGGEPTVYPKFKELIKYAKDIGIRQSIISNGSRTIRFWNEISRYFEKVHLSFHPEYALENPEHFIRNAQMICRYSDLHVNVLMLPGLFPEILLAAHQIRTACPNAVILLKPLQKNFGDELYDYSEHENKILADMHNFNTGSSIWNQRLNNYPTGQLKVTQRDGAERKTSASVLMMEKVNQWKGWNCQIGVETLNVDMNGEIRGGLCRVGGSFGNISTEFTLPTEGQVCTKDWCTCHLDIMVTKKTPGYHGNTEQDAPTIYAPYLELE